MGYSKLSVTIPDDVYSEIKAFASAQKVKVSHLVAEALAEKALKLKESALMQQINEAFDDPDVVKDQTRMAETIAATTDVEELPW